jgi:hypothetical protein
MRESLVFVTGMLSAVPFAFSLLWIAARVGDILPPDPVETL